MSRAAPSLTGAFQVPTDTRAPAGTYTSPTPTPAALRSRCSATTLRWAARVSAFSDDRSSPAAFSAFASHPVDWPSAVVIENRNSRAVIGWPAASSRAFSPALNAQKPSRATRLPAASRYDSACTQTGPPESLSTATGPDGGSAAWLADADNRTASTAARAR